MELNICPGCGRHCDLRNPHCGKGAEYFRASELPQAPHVEEGPRPSYRPQALSGNDKLIDALRDLSRIMRSQYEGRASQKRILMILNETGKITQRDLTERLAIQPGSASEILAKLENAGLIVRTQNEADRRTIDVQLTGPGRALAEEAAGQRRERHTEMFSCLSEEERETLLALLEKLRADWEARYRGSGMPREHEEPLCGHEGRGHGHMGRHHGHHGHHGRRGRG